MRLRYLPKINDDGASIYGQLTCPAYLKLKPLGCAMEQRLTQLLDSIDAAYRVAAKTDGEIASLLLLASLNVSQKIEADSACSERRSQRAAQNL
jgi:hypothetical protein